MKRQLLIALFVFGVAGPAHAQDTLPNLIGEWTGTSQTVVLGSGGHHPGQETLKDKPRLREVKLTIKIEGQDGNRIWGVIESADLSEPLLAVFASDNKTAIGADSDGVYHLMLKSADELEACYAPPPTGPTNSIVAACTSLSKTKRP